MMTSEERANLFNLSKGNLDKIDGYDCTICNNNGFVVDIGENGNTFAKRCKCQSIRETLRKAARSGIGNLLDYTFDKFVVSDEWQKKIKTTAQNFCNDDTYNWFYIGGQVGCGKTLICSIVSNYYVNKGLMLRYMIWNEEVKKLKAVINDRSYSELMKRYTDAEVLYIDDFLKTTRGEIPTSADMNIAFEIINQRIRQTDKITIISSEKTLEELMEYDEATMSRIYEKSGPYKLGIERNQDRNYRLKPQ